MTQCTSFLFGLGLQHTAEEVQHSSSPSDIFHPVPEWGQIAPSLGLFWAGGPALVGMLMPLVPCPCHIPNLNQAPVAHGKFSASTT